MKKAPIQVWSSLETSTILQALHADAGQGLSNDQARRLSAKYGPNQLTVRRGKGPLRLFLSQFHQPLIYNSALRRGLDGTLGGMGRQ